MEDPIRLGYLVSHPIQYQAPLLRAVARHPSIGFKVYYCSSETAGTYFDPGFGAHVTWDLPLLEGYAHETLPAIGHTHTFSFWRPFTYGLVRRFRLDRLDALWVHGYATWSSLSAIAVARLLGIKTLVRGESTPASAVERRGRRHLLSLLDRMCDGFLAIGSENRRFYRQYGIGDEKIFLMPYAVDNEWFSVRAKQASKDREALRRRLGLDRGRPVILFASKLSERKRPLDLLEAHAKLARGDASRLPYLVFVGEGNMRSVLEARIAELGVHDSVRMLGFKNQTELPAYYDLCDVFVLPSVKEPWGLVVNEVMNASRPVIVSDQVGCAADLVRDGVNGWVFKAGDVDALTSALQRATSADLEAMGRASAEIIESWSYEQDIHGLVGAIRRLCR